MGLSEGEREFFGVNQIVALVKTFREELDLPLFLNADHTHSLAGAIEAAKAGFDFDSVVFDLSALPFEENVSRTREAVTALKAINPDIIVEGEIGEIGTGSAIHKLETASEKSLTSPQEARQFVDATGIDVLAPAVGNMHGMSPDMATGAAKKRLNQKRIGEIKDATNAFLTLHGASGTNDEDLRGAISAGINIVHINTELRLAWRQGVEMGLREKPDEVVPYKVLPYGINAIKDAAVSRISLFNKTPLSSQNKVNGDARSD